MSVLLDFTDHTCRNVGGVPRNSCAANVFSRLPGVRCMKSKEEVQDTSQGVHAIARCRTGTSAGALMPLRCRCERSGIPLRDKHEDDWSLLVPGSFAY